MTDDESGLPAPGAGSRFIAPVAGRYAFTQQLGRPASSGYSVTLDVTNPALFFDLPRLRERVGHGIAVNAPGGPIRGVLTALHIAEDETSAKLTIEAEHD